MLSVVIIYDLVQNLDNFKNWIIESVNTFRAGEQKNNSVAIIDKELSNGESASYR